MDQINTFMNAIGTSLGPYAPRALGALSILLVAWIVAMLAKRAVMKLASVAQLDKRLQTPGIEQLLATLANGLVWLFTLPALLGTLELDGLLAPVNAMMSRLMGFLPNVIGAVVIFGIGFLAARILRQVVTGLLTAAGSEKLVERMGLTSAMGKNTLAGVVGTALFILILLPTVTASLQALGLDAVAKPVGQLLDSVFDLIPKLIAAAVIVTIGAILGRLLAGLLTGVLSGLGFNNLPQKIGMSDGFRLAGRDLTELVGGAVMMAAVMMALTQACEVLGFAVLTQAVAILGVVLVKLAVAVVVFGVGLWAAALAAQAIADSHAVNAVVLSHIARGAIMFFAAALALSQAGLPENIVAIAFGSVVGAVAVGAAIAIGLGGQKVAARLLESFATSFERPKDSDEKSANDLVDKQD